MERYVCVHGHFYQPPRENPWLEAIELQDSAYPYHDWNERITTECYAPNSASRILDASGKITAIVNNYSKMSFNFGPTLLAWLEPNSPDVYRAILAADQESQRRFSGHGSALAQGYGHVILPLANSRDKKTQVLWGIRDFEHRFRRKPEGLWLPETAVDVATLEVLADAGIKFTILAPNQAARVRMAGTKGWKDVSGGRIDPSTPYRIRLSNRRSMALFFYDGPISRAIAFEDLLGRGENLANRLAGAFSAARTWTQLVHIATDGETYGHHKAHGDMALAYALDYIESADLARLTNYGEFLEKNPPVNEVKIFENSSWSCVHGVERWKSDCGCNSGGHAGWRQDWRAPLREALDWLRDQLAPRFEEQARNFFHDPWRARDEYINVVLDRSPESIARFMHAQAVRPLQPDEEIKALKLMELQRQAMLMYTSCGWFFDELSGIETVQVMHYAGRALQLGQELFGDGVEEEFLNRLALAKSNLPEHGDGRAIYEKWVKPSKVDLSKVAAHYAVSSVFEEFPERSHIYAFDVNREDFHLNQQGRARMALGRARITSRITRESALVSFGVLHLGDQNVSGGVREYQPEAYESLMAETRQIFDRGDIPEAVRSIDRNFGKGIYSLRLLFRDEQRKIVGRLMEHALSEASTLYRNFSNQFVPLARFVTDLSIPLPARFQRAVEFSLHDELVAALSAEDPDVPHIQALLDQIARTGISLDYVTLEFLFRQNLQRAAKRFLIDPFERQNLERFARLAALCSVLPFSVNLWTAQNAFHEVRSGASPVLSDNKLDPAETKDWEQKMDSLGEHLGFANQPATVSAGTFH